MNKFIKYAVVALVLAVATPVLTAQADGTPQITAISPNPSDVSTANNPSFITITGTNFIFESNIVTFKNSSQTTVSQKLGVMSINNTVSVDPGIGLAGQYSVYIENTNGKSAAYTLTISSSTPTPPPTTTPPTTNAPTLTSIAPVSGTTGTNVVLTGTGFLTGVDVNYSVTAYGSGTIQHVAATSNGTSAQFQIPTWLPTGTYNITTVNTNGLSNAKVFMVTPQVIGDPPPVVTHFVGTNIVGTNGTVYKITEGNVRSPYTSSGAFLSYKFNTWESVVAANSLDMALPLSSYTPSGQTQTVTAYIPPRNGSLIIDKGTVYIITGGLRAGFVSEQVFKDSGYLYSSVYPGDTSFMVTAPPINSASRVHPNGGLINDNGTIYVMQNGYRVGFPNMAVLDSWGYWISEAVPANSYDRQAAVSGVMQTRMANQMSI